LPQQVRFRQQAATIAFSANNRVAEDLARGMVYRELVLRLQGKPTITATNNTEAKAERGDEWGVLKSLEIVANGTDVIKKIDGNALWWLNYFMYGAAPRVTAALAGGAANPAFDSVLILPFWMPLAVKPIDTALDSRELSSLEIVAQWGTYTDVNGDASAWTTEPTLEVYSLESFNTNGPFSQWRIHPIEKTIDATSSRFQVQLPVGPIYRGFMINTIDGTADQSDILNNFKLISGTTVFADISAGDDVLQQWHSLRHGISRPWDSAAEAYDDLRRASDNDLDGWYFYDHITDGRLTEGIDTLGFSEFIAECDVTVGAGTTKLTLYPLAIIPVRGG